LEKTETAKSFVLEPLEDFFMARKPTYQELEQKVELTRYAIENRLVE